MQKSLDNLVRQAENIPLSGSDLNRITEGKTNILAYESLEKYNNIDDVLGPHGACIILYQHDEDFGHWICIFRIDSKTLYFFDPYAIQIDKEIKFSPFQLRQHEGKVVPHLSILIGRSKYKLIQNKTRYQRFKKDVNTCGRWCAHRILHRSMSEKSYSKLMLGNEHYNGDFWISILTIPSIQFLM
tara:strand:+ start:3552 stop:4106 length:555 start_codon:yes stop_codon:yes gene_type:complete